MSRVDDVVGLDREHWMDALVDDVLAETRTSTAKYGRTYASAHEAHSVLREELEEFWDHVKANTGYSDEAYHEAKQVASVALKVMQTIVQRRSDQR